MWLFVEKVFFNEMCVKKKENRIFIFKGVIFLIIYIYVYVEYDYIGISIYLYKIFWSVYVLIMNKFFFGWSFNDV